MTATKILVIDDSVMTRNMVTNLLKQLNYLNITTARSADEAVRTVTDAFNSGAPFELIFCDIKMPGMTGDEFLSYIRKQSATPEAAFIVVSAESESTTILDLIKGGADGFVAKPISLKTLADTIARSLAKRKVRLESKT